MRIKLSALRTIIAEAMISEIDIADVHSVVCAAGSTHIMQTCKIGKDKYFLKFSDENLFDESDPSLQVLIEYLAYRIYGLYPGVTIPANIQLVYDKAQQRVGLASSAVSGKMGKQSIPAQKLGKMMSAGVYVDVFLANWDVVGMGSGNVIVDKNKATRIDPGGALTFRAQGGRKGKKFSPQPGEIKTMLDPHSGAGEVLSYADMKLAMKEFVAIPWSAISTEIKSVADEVSNELNSRKMKKLLGQWNDDVSEISSTLKARHKSILDHIKSTLEIA
jgi:hypothetical protein